MPELFRSKPDTLVVALSDREEILGELRRALASADDAERPGLGRAIALVEAVPSRSEAELRGLWARERIASTGFPLADLKPDSIAAVRALRKAEPGLRLVQALALTKLAAAPDAQQA
ncbi:hypothetical protein [Streptomyces candidus]|uniref:Uncharacterized protein n=1 Tax=Streptomyces candidus TaxID=67283 RepID=A0A7X0HCG6_9ACTN|nr:hypothetical protein [Streptomyces candidus]MBB6435020.1 hypothetical protein [Streptomyces candidus]GHH41011.1 hypothetical protein GCM10018773_23490 [Streptomyces candidus]